MWIVTLGNYGNYLNSFETHTLDEFPGFKLAKELQTIIYKSIKHHDRSYVHDSNMKVKLIKIFVDTRNM